MWVVGEVGEAVVTVCVEVAVMVWCVLTAAACPYCGAACRPIATATVTAHSPTSLTTSITTSTHVCVWWVRWVRRWRRCVWRWR